MKNKFLWIMFFSCIIFCSSCTKKKSQQVRHMAAVEAVGMLQNDFAVLVDVREKGEVDGGMASKAIWYPTSKIEADPKAFEAFLKTLPSGREVIFYCASGRRAHTAAEKALSLGYKTANMGGYKDWVAAGLPVK